MSDKLSRIFHFVEEFERVSLRILEAADKISFRLLLYALALWHVYGYFTGKH
jgi:hypothetical protein